MANDLENFCLFEKERALFCRLLDGLIRCAEFIHAMMSSKKTDASFYPPNLFLESLASEGKKSFLSKALFQ